jgi:CDP-glucose 4,6-dehydratase
MVIDSRFWRGRRVFLTGHTGFKGAWMSLLLGRLGAEVYGYALAPEEPSLFQACGIESDVRHLIADVRDANAVQRALAAAQPEIVIHMAAQSLVQHSFVEPAATFATNAMGTVNVLEAIRHVPRVRAALIVTSDKCYDNREVARRYTETDPLGGNDPYSASKGCAELIATAYRKSFFSASDKCAVASARAGNAIGGGDWARDRLVPDAMRAFSAGKTLLVRNPNAVRPWQHVLDPILAYLLLAERLVERGSEFAEAWNFGPDFDLPVSVIADRLAAGWGKEAVWKRDTAAHPPEANYLQLDCSKAKTRLGWKPLIDIENALATTVDWYRACRDGRDMRLVTIKQIEPHFRTS